jgi:branched-chain amino acid transport system permease protein
MSLTTNHTAAAVEPEPPRRPVSRSPLRRGRPDLYTRYEDHQALLNTRTKRVGVAVFLAALVLGPLVLDGEWVSLLTLVFASAVGALGLNLVTGYAGQISLGHAFFLGLGAYTAAVVGDATEGLWGMGLGMWAWLPLAGLVSALVGFVVAPLAARLRGLYLAIVTLSLVFIAEHVFRELEPLTGGVGVGRSSAPATLFDADLTATTEVLGIPVGQGAGFYWLCLVVAFLSAVACKNLVRSKVGRAFAAVRDRDIAAEVMGVPLTRTKVVAFTVSSFFAGICGALLSVANGGYLEPTSYDLMLSVDFLVMVLIGGAATISGSLMGAAFVVLLPRLVSEVPQFLPFVDGSSDQDGVINVFQLQTILFGVLIVVFLVLEPRGLHGLWVRIRNYWKAWPFSY